MPDDPGWWEDHDDHDPGYDPADDWFDKAVADFQESTNAHRPMVTPDEIAHEDGPDPDLDEFHLPRRESPSHDPHAEDHR